MTETILIHYALWALFIAVGVLILTMSIITLRRLIAMEREATLIERRRIAALRTMTDEIIDANKSEETGG